MMRSVKRLPIRELPPRARRIQPYPQPLPPPRGTTSACAENTPLGFGGALLRGNYLRVRGEYVSMKPLITSRSELPPRARRIPVTIEALEYLDGTTSACAENTLNELDLL